MAPTAILTSQPLLLSQVPLASFVPDVTEPYVNVKRPYTVSQSDYSTRDVQDFKGLVTSSSESFLQILATRFANLVVRREQGSTYGVVAERGRLYTLDSPDDLFTAILTNKQTGEETKRWLEQRQEQDMSPRFVIALCTFVDAKLSRGENKSNEVQGAATLPLSSTHGDMTGMSDVKAGVGHKARNEIQGEAVLPGEMIYAIAYRKIGVKRRKGGITATLDLKTKWESFSGSRSEDGPGTMYLEADMSSTDDSEDCKNVFDMTEPGCDGQTVRIAVLDEDDSEEDKETS